MLIYLVRSSHTWMPWSHGPPPPTFIVSQWGYGLSSQVQSILGNSSIVDISLQGGLVTIVDKHMFAR